jgi:hypothetical protein
MPKLDKKTLKLLKESNYWLFASVYVNLYESDLISLEEFIKGVKESAKQQLAMDRKLKKLNSMNSKEKKENIK